MILNEEEKRILNGEYGTGAQVAIDSLIKLGESSGAQRMAKI